MIEVLILFALTLAGPASPPAPSSNDWTAAAEALDQAVDEAIGKMSPDERAQLESEVEHSATLEMQAGAQRCGTALVFSKEPRFEDRTVWTSSDATAEQTACVQHLYPFVRAAPK